MKNPELIEALQSQGSIIKKHYEANEEHIKILRLEIEWYEKLNKENLEKIKNLAAQIRSMEE
jgi:hypothetical protein